MGTNTELESKVGLSAAALASLLYSHYGQPHSMEVSHSEEHGLDVPG